MTDVESDVEVEVEVESDIEVEVEIEVWLRRSMRLWLMEQRGLKLGH